MFFCIIFICFLWMCSKFSFSFYCFQECIYARVTHTGPYFPWDSLSLWNLWFVSFVTFGTVSVIFSYNNSSSRSLVLLLPRFTCMFDHLMLIHNSWLFHSFFFPDRFSFLCPLVWMLLTYLQVQGILKGFLISDSMICISSLFHLAPAYIFHVSFSNPHLFMRGKSSNILQLL